MSALDFYQDSRMSWWPAAQVNDEADRVQIGDYGGSLGHGVGPLGEFGISWKLLGQRSGQGSARIEAFDDAWGCFGTPHGLALIAWLGARHKSNPGPAEVCAFLRSIGCKDLSEKEVE